MRWTDDAKGLLKALPEDTRAMIERHESEGTTEGPEYQEAVMGFAGDI
jgi:hypothetical protein